MNRSSDEILGRPLSRAEMEAMRRAADDEQGVLRDALRLLKRIGKRLPFAEDALAAYFCATDATTDRKVKLILVAALAYFVMPVDLIPDVLPIIGFTDDAAVMAAALAAVSRAIKPEHRDRAKSALEERGPA